MNNTKIIAPLSGPLLVFGGVYSNLQALEQLRKIAAVKGIPASNIICTGDVVAYCAQPEEVVQSIRNWGIHCIAGNVEIQLREGEAGCGCNFNEDSRCDLLSRQWYPYAQQQLSQESIDWMQTLPEFIRFDYAGKKVLVVHGSCFDTSEFIFRSTPWVVKQANFTETKSDLILAGHCGLPFYHQHENQLWLNPGVIGVPANDGTTRVWYALLEDQDGLEFQQCTFEYDHQQAAKLMREKGLPASYALTLETGLWDNCEILPETETAEMGHCIIAARVLSK